MHNDSIFCRFGTTIVQAEYLSASSISCVSPEVSSALHVFVEVVANSIDYSNSGVSFNYFSEIVIYDITPRKGPEYGGTILFVRGENFLRSDRLSCKIGTWTVIRKYVCQSSWNGIFEFYKLSLQVW